MALWWAITSHPHKHGRPLTLSAFPPVAVQLSDSLDPCRLHTEAASRSDLWTGITAESRRFILYLPTMLPWWWMGGEVEADQARYRSRNSPETKKLFFTATESVCMCGFFTWTQREALVSTFFAQVLCYNKCSETARLFTRLYHLQVEPWLEMLK